MKPNLVLMSHGNLASSFIEASKIILGDLGNYDTIDMLENDTFDTIENKLELILDKAENNDILILTDLYGCTPFNIANRFYKKHDNIFLISGMNLDMVIEYFASDVHDDIHKLIEDIVSVSRDSIVLHSKKVRDLYEDIEIN